MHTNNHIDDIDKLQLRGSSPGRIEAASRVRIGVVLLDIVGRVDGIDGRRGRRSTMDSPTRSTDFAL